MFCFPALPLFKNIKVGMQSDMENVRNFTRVGLFITKFYPKVPELRQFQNCNKTEFFYCHNNVYNIYILT